VKKPFLFALGLVAVTAAACGGKVVVESSGGTGAGGAGGTPSTFTTADGAPGQTSIATVGVGPSTAAATSVTTGTGTGACDPAYTCAEAITPPAADPSKLCDNTVHAKLYDALTQCVCVDSCQIECSGSACIGQPTSPSCATCVQDPMTGCGNQFNACANDI
jgi:hypothetical protein